METLPRLAWQLDLSWLYFPATSRVPARAAPANGMAQRHIAGLGPAQGKDCPGSYHHASQGRRLGFQARVGPPEAPAGVAAAAGPAGDHPPRAR